jgi:putative phage-type endonuclease
VEGGTIVTALAVRQRTPEWLEERRKGIGSSDAPIIAGVAPWGDLRTLYADKIGLAVPAIENEPMRWGRLLEDAVAEGYTEITGNKLRRINLIQRHPRYPFMLASLDRAIVGRRRILEIKTARFRGDGWGEPGTDQIPDHYTVQVQHQMAVTGYPEADVAVLFSGSDLKLYSLQRDPRLIDGLIELEQAFWKCVTTRTPPPDAPITRLPVRTEAIEADERTTAIVAHLRELRSRYAAAKAAKDETEDALRLVLGDATDVRGDGFRITYKAPKDTVKIGWEQIATAYRGLLGERPELDVIQGLYTTIAPATPRLRVTWEGTDDE